MRRRIVSLGASSILAGLVLLVVWFYANTRQFMFMERVEDNYMELALNFAHAAYVKDWDGSAEQLQQVYLAKNGAYHPQSSKSKIFNGLALSGWNLYFNEIGVSMQALQDAQILTGSKKEKDCQITFVVAFRGSDKPEDFLFTNCKNEPFSFGRLEMFKDWKPEKGMGDNTRQFYVPGVPMMAVNSLVVGFSNLFAGEPVFAHRGYVEQVAYALSAKIVDPEDGGCLTVLQALKKYPFADFIITGHSAGGGDAHVLSVLVGEMGLNQQNRIHTRTFAAAGAFNHAGQIKYQGLDSINYFIPGDPIMFVNGISGYGPIGVNVILPTSPVFQKYSKTIHEMPAYEKQLIKD